MVSSVVTQPSRVWLRALLVNSRVPWQRVAGDVATIKAFHVDVIKNAATEEVTEVICSARRDSPPEISRS